MASDGRVVIDTELDRGGFETGLTKMVNAQSKLLGVAKSVMTGFVAHQVFEIGKMFVGAYADYEQLVGGVETLFKDSSDIVQNYAANAAQSAGLSANEYMETVTGFSASLLQSLGGDTEKAAHVANMAVTDMADNANKMGTSMEMIQNAYQGFAKQNYTMLDNLKLGYGGTKSEMERLIADANKVKAANGEMADLSIDSFADVTEAIHVMQVEMGIFGTTKDEAAKTISGSFATLKATFENLMVAIGSGDSIEVLYENVYDFSYALTTFLVDNLIPRVLEIIATLPAAILILMEDLLPRLMEQADGSFESFLEFLDEKFPELLEKGTEAITYLALGVVTGIPSFVASALEALGQFVVTILTNLPQIIAAGTQILLSMISGISTSIPNLLTTAAEVIGMVITGLVQNLPQIIAAGFQMIVSLIGGISDAFPDILRAALQVVKMIWETIKKVDWIGLGKSIIQGMIDGIGAMGHALWEAAKNIAKKALDAIKEFFGIASPSKVMRNQVGKFIPQGLALGIADEAWRVRKAMNDVSSAAFDAADKKPPKGASSGSGGMGGDTINIYGDVNDPDVVARKIRKERQYGLAGAKA